MACSAETAVALALISAGVGVATGLAVAARVVRRRTGAQRDAERSVERDERSALMGAMGSGLAHELKTPLSTLEINLQLLEEEWRKPETERERRAHRRLETIQRSIRKIDEILTSFVRFAKDPRPNRQPTPAGPLLQELLEKDFPEALATMGRLGKIHVTYDISPELPKIDVDVPLIRQVLMNLLINAVESIEGEGRVTLGAEASGGEVVLRVSDTGRGIAPEHRERVWDMYFTTKPSGIGLGLPLARRIVEAHGGRIEFETNGGTTFRVYLPVKRA